MVKLFKVLLLVSCLIFASLISGCSDEGEKYIGNWVGIAYPNDLAHSPVYQISIEKNGDNYLIKSKYSNYDEYNKDNQLVWQDDPGSTKTATLKDGKLVVDGTMGADTIVLNEKDGTLLYPAAGDKLTLIKDDNGEKFKELQKQVGEALTKYWQEHPKVHVADNPFKEYGNSKW